MSKGSVCALFVLPVVFRVKECMSLSVPEFPERQQQFPTISNSSKWSNSGCLPVGISTVIELPMEVAPLWASEAVEKVQPSNGCLLAAKRTIDGRVDVRVKWT